MDASAADLTEEATAMNFEEWLFCAWVAVMMFCCIWMSMLIYQIFACRGFR